MYHNPSETRIHITNVLVVLLAAKAQFETRKNAFFPILIPNYDLSETICNLTRISLQFYSSSQSLLFISPLFLFDPIPYSGRRYNYCNFRYANLSTTKKRGPSNQPQRSLFRHNFYIFIISSTIVHQEVCRPATQPLSPIKQDLQSFHLHQLRETRVEIILRCGKIDNMWVGTAFYSGR